MSKLPDSPAKRGLIGAGVALSLPTIVVAQRDLGRRSADEVRGPGFLWRIVSANGLGALAYLVLGRR